MISFFWKCRVLFCKGTLHCRPPRDKSTLSLQLPTFLASFPYHTGCFLVYYTLSPFVLDVNKDLLQSFSLSPLGLLLMLLWGRRKICLASKGSFWKGLLLLSPVFYWILPATNRKYRYWPWSLILASIKMVTINFLCFVKLKVERAFEASWDDDKVLKANLFDVMLLQQEFSSILLLQ